MRLFSSALFIFISCASLCFPFTLAEKLKKAENGDYIVTEQDKNYSLLLIRSVEQDSLILEEISIPCEQMKKNSWRLWLESGAPGHTSWVMYEIDLSTHTLLEAYSFTKRGWLYVDGSNHFLSKLLSLPLIKIPFEERKRIGPAPASGEEDHRSTWNPALVVEGKKTKASFDVWKAKWPKDDSLLSSCDIQLYFRPGNEFAFPYWIEASNGHYSYAIKAVDSGNNLKSPQLQNLPRRPPVIGKMEREDDKVRLTVKAPTYYKRFQLFVFDITRPFEHIGPIPFTMQKGDTTISYFYVEDRDLNAILNPGHHYKWLLFPEKSSILYVESEDFFHWPLRRKAKQVGSDDSGAGTQ